jgi:hypothetical protein
VRVATRYASSFIEVGMTTPAKRLAGFIAKFDPGIARLARSCRTVLRRRFPTAVELAYDNYNALAIGYASTERASDCIVSLAVFPRSVALSFYYGASLPDPTNILSGSGNQNRYISLDRPDRLKDPAVEALIKAAIANGKVSLPTSKGYLVIKSISAKQRPRRPSAIGARSRPR